MRQFIVLFALVLLGWLMQGVAQDSAGVAGLITDPSGAAVPNAVVTLFARDNSLRFYNPYKPARGISIRLRSARRIFNGG